MLPWKTWKPGIHPRRVGMRISFGCASLKSAVSKRFERKGNGREIQAPRAEGRREEITSVPDRDQRHGARLRPEACDRHLPGCATSIDHSNARGNGSNFHSTGPSQWIASTPFFMT